MHTITLLRQGRTKQKVLQKVTNESHEKIFLNGTSRFPLIQNSKSSESKQKRKQHKRRRNTLYTQPTSSKA